MELSNTIKKRFVNDFNIPINIFEEKIFLERLEQFNLTFKSKNKYNFLTETIKKLGSEKDFFDESDRIIKTIQEYIKKSEKYKELQQNELTEYSKFIKDTKNKYKFNKNLYTEQNIGKYFISIDLKEANFNTFKNMNILNFKDYKEFIETFTNYDYFKESKQIRQIVFGHLLPKKQTIIQEYEICKIIEKIQLNKNGVIILNKDEVVFEVNKDFDLETIMNLKLSNFPLRIEKFKLIELRDKKDTLYFIKDYGNKKELKSVPKIYYIQAYKKMMNIKIEDNDLIFFYEGFPAKFIESVF